MLIDRKSFDIRLIFDFSGFFSILVNSRENKRNIENLKKKRKIEKTEKANEKEKRERAGNNYANYVPRYLKERINVHERVYHCDCKKKLIKKNYLTLANETRVELRIF